MVKITAGIEGMASFLIIKAFLSDYVHRAQANGDVIFCSQIKDVYYARSDGIKLGLEIIINPKIEKADCRAARDML